MRPSSIVRFDRLYLLSIVIGLVGNAVEWPVSIARLNADPNTAALGGAVIGFAGAMIALGTLIALLLWYFIARRGSTVAKWILVVFTGIAIGSLLIGFRSGAVIVDTGGIIRVVAIALQTAAVALLFARDAAPWFEPAVIEEEI
jgi:hypothetical protein